ncbi:MAG: GGDEF domain-containing protein [Lachnospiraceae bacterium]|nr:GGDEF domain-containing protein [Lachnospiraceae bacterium]
MNLQAILVANITGFILILFLYFSRRIGRSKDDTESHAFDWMMILAMIACLIEPLTFAVDGIHSRIGYWVNLLGNTYLYYANGVGAFLWMMYVDLKLFHNPARMKKIYYKISVPVSALLISLIGNIWWKYYFYVDENFVYHRQPTIYVFYVYIMLCGAYSVGLYCYRKHVYGEVVFFPIYMYLIPIMIGSVLQMLFYGVSLAWLGTAVGLVALHMSVQQQNTYMDALTGLYNRMYLDYRLYRLQRYRIDHCYGLMIDMNDFKKINDTYGHSAGNRALKDMADLFNAVVDKDATIFRYAGDEFIILVYRSSEEEVRQLEADLHLATDAFNKRACRLYQLSFAVGHSEFESGWDTSDSFMKRIDEAMYEDKRKYHEGNLARSS